MPRSAAICSDFSCGYRARRVASCPAVQLTLGRRIPRLLVMMPPSRPQPWACRSCVAQARTRYISSKQLLLHAGRNKPALNPRNNADHRIHHTESLCIGSGSCRTSVGRPLDHAAEAHGVAIVPLAACAALVGGHRALQFVAQGAGLDDHARLAQAAHHGEHLEAAGLAPTGALVRFPGQRAAPLGIACLARSRFDDLEFHDCTPGTSSYLMIWQRRMPSSPRLNAWPFMHCTSASLVAARSTTRTAMSA